jgi:import inner membrane translocase subunit TIM16
MSVSLFRIIYQGAKIAYRSLYKSLVEEIEISREAARIRYQHVQPEESHTSRKDMTLAEAMQILDIRNVDPAQVEKRFKHLFQSNEKSNGGSFYLQSKVFRAKQRLDVELKKQSTSQPLPRM